MRAFFPAFPWLLSVALLTACAQAIRLSEKDRAGLVSQPSIRIVHFETPLPVIAQTGKRTPPAAFEVRRQAGTDPADLIAQGFHRLWARKVKNENMQLEASHQPHRDAIDGGHYRALYRHGTVLELWVDDWRFNPLPNDGRAYAMSLSARSRLVQVEDGRVLWSTGRCGLGGNAAGNRYLRLAEAELTSGTKLRKVMTAARDDCVRQLLRDFETARNAGTKG